MTASATRGEARRWRYVLRCPDCTGQDEQGCFGGGSEESEETYATAAEADAAGAACVARSIWEYDLESVDPERGPLSTYTGRIVPADVTDEDIAADLAAKEMT